MDTISSSISTLKGPAFLSTLPELQHLRTPHVSHLLPPNLTTKPNSSISNRTPSETKTLSFKNLNPPLFSNISQSSSHNSSPHIHRNPVSGYAAALVDIARCKSSLDIVQNDVQKLSKLLQNEQIQAVLGSPFVGDKEKGQVVKEVAKRGKFNRYLVGLVKMLIDRNKVMIVSDVLMEFERICDEMSGTRVVLVPSPKKMKEDQLFWIAKTVQNLTGAVNVKPAKLNHCKKVCAFNEERAEYQIHYAWIHPWDEPRTSMPFKEHASLILICDGRGPAGDSSKKYRE